LLNDVFSVTFDLSESTYFDSDTFQTIIIKVNVNGNCQHSIKHIFELFHKLNLADIVCLRNTLTRIETNKI
jgi:hypothetical protein